MNQMLQEETLIFLGACLLGAAIAACYDTLRLIRVMLPHPRFLINLEDFLFFVAAAVVTFAFFLSYSDGGFRIFILAGELLGAVLYFFSISLVLLRLLSPVMRLARRLLRGIFHPFVLLFQRIKGKFTKISKNTVENTKKFARNLQLGLKNRKRVVYNKHDPQTGEPPVEDQVEKRGILPQ